MNKQTKTNWTFAKVNKLFVLWFKNEEDKTSFLKHYTPIVEITNFNVLINGKSFVNVPMKNKKEAYEKIIEMSKNNDYTKDNLLDYEYFLNHYNLIVIDLITQFELESPNLK